MGSGKSTVGRLLAARLDRPYLDLDQAVEEAAGRTVAEIFQDEGEASFREREESALLALGEVPPRVVATGGGVAARTLLRERMRETGCVVWLQVRWETVLHRLGSERTRRPLFGLLRESGVRQLFETRQPSYRQAAHFAVNAEGPPASVAEDVLDRMKEVGWPPRV
jgi:shikimate kinase